MTYIYIQNKSVNFERVEWAPSVTGVGVEGYNRLDWARWGSSNRYSSGGSIHRCIRSGGVQKGFSAPDSNFKTGTNMI